MKGVFSLFHFSAGGSSTWVFPFTFPSAPPALPANFARRLVCFQAAYSLFPVLQRPPSRVPPRPLQFISSPYSFFLAKYIFISLFFCVWLLFFLVEGVLSHSFIRLFFIPPSAGLHRLIQRNYLPKGIGPSGAKARQTNSERILVKIFIFTSLILIFIAIFIWKLQTMIWFKYIFVTLNLIFVLFKIFFF